MDIYKLLNQVKEGAVSIEEAARSLRDLPYEDLDFAKIDHHRTLRNGFGEVIFGAGKTSEQLMTILSRYAASGTNVLVTKVSPNQAAQALSDLPDLIWDQQSGTLRLQYEAHRTEGRICVCTGGTSDIRIAEEAAMTAEFFGAQVDRVYDVGVAGIHRLFDQMEVIHRANAVIAIAGMEGALGTVIAGLVDKPVICVPTSVGYGASFGGLAALLTMLNSCAEGLAVVNIDNGFGAGYLAAQINRLALRGNTERDQRADQLDLSDQI
ncbi:MAG: nickel pincer cofactor biosynthesis protein LarB [Fastidiosipilaceae bacterium]